MGWSNALGRLAFAKKHDRTPQERAFVRRLDLFLMTFGYQTNITSAYVSGMKENLSLYGNELNYFTTYFNIGYCIMLIPSQIILTYVRPSLWLPGLETAWGVITGLIAIVHNAKQIYALRFFLGLLESSAWPGMITLLMYWYTPSELAKRMGFYHSARAVGGMMSGALQVAILNTLDGRSGLPGWRWLFIINAIMTIVLGFFGFVMLPDTPNRPNPWARWWFRENHRSIAIKRLERYGRAEAKKITWAASKRAARMWITYYIPAYWVVNAIPIGGGAIQVVCSTIGLIPAIIMTIWTRNPNNVPLNAAYASYFMTYTVQASGLILLAWFTDMYPQDPEARALVVGISVVAIYAVDAGSQVSVWPATQAPYYKTGWVVMLSMWVAGIILIVGLHLLDKRYLLPKRVVSRESQTDPEPSELMQGSDINNGQDSGDKSHDTGVQITRIAQTA
ncbi:hypothetical protein FDECE_6109 [Fusarium decemcellulare]|nr:hypothetical protein FDECE_6109 [Fusarium decemcellulare]